uniref:Uncharacterized protein n=1 Tax=Rhizophora mucronata TaxID=61149 RepID=A0A2P2N2F2_RHIMU
MGANQEICLQLLINRRIYSLCFSLFLQLLTECWSLFMKYTSNFASCFSTRT